ncbi:MAG: 5-oxoprolinase subunit PxpB [Candidatus Dormibacteraeota bacterium]|nr:5-oxoprolinase subunit PxpB [Candidatus Dormibacteraeota bacterium]
MAERTYPLGDAAMVVELGARIDTALNARCHALAAALNRRPGVREACAGYSTVTVHYDPERTTLTALRAAITRLLAAKTRVGPSGRLHRIPVDYDGPDLAEAAGLLGITTTELISTHASAIYRVFMVGFVPGWAYLGPLPALLHLPRRRVPRTHVPAGSVAIAGEQTGVYPLATPGGWHLIGRTSVPMFLPDSDPPSLFRPGDRVKFHPV